MVPTEFVEKWGSGYFNTPPRIQSEPILKNKWLPSLWYLNWRFEKKKGVLCFILCMRQVWRCGRRFVIFFDSHNVAKYFADSTPMHPTPWKALCRTPWHFRDRYWASPSLLLTQLAGQLVNAGFYGSLFMHLIITINRFCAISYPMYYRRLFNKANARTTALLLWLFVMLLCIPYYHRNPFSNI